MDRATEGCAPDVLLGLLHTYKLTGMSTGWMWNDLGWTMFLVNSARVWVSFATNTAPALPRRSLEFLSFLRR